MNEVKLAGINHSCFKWFKTEKILNENPDLKTLGMEGLKEEFLLSQKFPLNVDARAKYYASYYFKQFSVNENRDKKFDSKKFLRNAAFKIITAGSDFSVLRKCSEYLNKNDFFDKSGIPVSETIDFFIRVGIAEYGFLLNNYCRKNNIKLIPVGGAGFSFYVKKPNKKSKEIGFEISNEALAHEIELKQPELCLMGSPHLDYVNSILKKSSKVQPKVIYQEKKLSRIKKIKQFFFGRTPLKLIRAKKKLFNPKRKL